MEPAARSQTSPASGAASAAPATRTKSPAARRKDANPPATEAKATAKPKATGRPTTRPPCKWCGERVSDTTHEGACPKKLYKCKGCAVTLPARQLAAHAKKCGALEPLRQARAPPAPAEAERAVSPEVADDAVPTPDARPGDHRRVFFRIEGAGYAGPARIRVPSGARFNLLLERLGVTALRLDGALLDPLSNPADVKLLPGAARERVLEYRVADQASDALALQETASRSREASLLRAASQDGGASVLALRDAWRGDGDDAGDPPFAATVLAQQFTEDKPPVAEEAPPASPTQRAFSAHGWRGSTSPEPVDASPEPPVVEQRVLPSLVESARERAVGSTAPTAAKLRVLNRQESVRASGSAAPVMTGHDAQSVVTSSSAHGRTHAPFKVTLPRSPAPSHTKSTPRLSRQSSTLTAGAVASAVTPQQRPAPKPVAAVEAEAESPHPIETTAVPLPLPNDTAQRASPVRVLRAVPIVDLPLAGHGLVPRPAQVAPVAESTASSAAGLPRCTLCGVGVEASRWAAHRRACAERSYRPTPSPAPSRASAAARKKRAVQEAKRFRMQHTTPRGDSHLWDEGHEEPVRHTARRVVLDVWDGAVGAAGEDRMYHGEEGYHQWLPAHGGTPSSLGDGAPMFAEVYAEPVEVGEGAPVPVAAEYDAPVYADPYAAEWAVDASLDSWPQM